MQMLSDAPSLVNIIRRCAAVATTTHHEQCNKTDPKICRCRSTTMCTRRCCHAPDPHAQRKRTAKYHDAKEWTHVGHRFNVIHGFLLFLVGLILAICLFVVSRKSLVLVQVDCEIIIDCDRARSKHCIQNQSNANGKKSTVEICSACCRRRGRKASHHDTKNQIGNVGNTSAAEGFLTVSIHTVFKSAGLPTLNGAIVFIFC
mmetsp:Transcript_100066/g.158357  ORF Transcript_100066/g.158357 Transcript_100066/m.158357 type:complete len:202 (+) Transcript_100066:63-668(+)